MSRGTFSERLISLCAKRNAHLCSPAAGRRHVHLRDGQQAFLVSLHRPLRSLPPARATHGALNLLVPAGGAPQRLVLARIPQRRERLCALRSQRSLALLCEQRGGGGLAQRLLGGGRGCFGVRAEGLARHILAQLSPVLCERGKRARARVQPRPGGCGLLEEERVASG